MPQIVRSASAEDLTQLVKLEAQTFDYSQLGRQSFRRFLQSTSAHLFVLEEPAQPQLLGYGLVLTRKNSKVWRLYSIAVAAAARGTGVGRRLLEHALMLAKNAGAAGMSLEVRSDNKAAIELYRRYDFEVVDLLPDYYPGHADGYRMRLTFN